MFSQNLKAQCYQHFSGMSWTIMIQSVVHKHTFAGSGVSTCYSDKSTSTETRTVVSYMYGAQSPDETNDARLFHLSFVFPVSFFQVNLCSPANNETYQERLLRLEGDKESLVLQVRTVCVCVITARDTAPPVSVLWVCSETFLRHFRWTLKVINWYKVQYKKSVIWF